MLDISGITNYLDALEGNSQDEDIAFGVTGWPARSLAANC